MRALLHAVAIATLLVSCDVGHGSECEAARTEIVTHMTALCRDTTTAYPGSPFCTDCIDRGYYSTTGAARCECQPLTFDADFCTYAIGPESKARVRSAIDWANSQCAHFFLPQVDAGTDEAHVDANAPPDSPETEAEPD